MKIMNRLIVKNALSLYPKTNSPAGSTGSRGTQTLDIARSHKDNCNRSTHGTQQCRFADWAVLKEKQV